MQSTSDAVRAICSADPSISGAQVAAALAELRGEGTREICGEPPPRAFSRSQVAALLGCTPRTVTLYAQRGLLVPIYAGRERRRAQAYTGESVAKLLSGGISMAQHKGVSQ